MNENEQWISLNEYMRRYHMGYEVVKKMIANKEVDYRTTPGGRYKIKIGGNAVAKELYELEKEKRIRAETKIEMLKKMILEEVN